MKRLFASSPTQRYLDKVNDLIKMIKEPGDDCGTEHDRQVVLEGVSLVLLALERICFMLSVIAGLLLGLIFK